MKPCVLPINTAWGELINPKALIEQVLNGHPAGAALDVFGEQPLNAVNSIVALDRIVYCPCISLRTEDRMLRTGATVVFTIPSIG